MQVNDIEDEKMNHRENHIWRKHEIVLKWNAHEYPVPYYNIPYAIPYLDWHLTLKEQNLIVIKLKWIPNKNSFKQSSKVKWKRINKAQGKLLFFR